ncbi:hypothetical protein MSG28_006825 [Choristoneura fumiferana]|uniref:Uncharacterized protein n=1 Tax=Choristoneura fumiferana TaxID=7141 RepID=A0ACC0JL85_CHOFU|nr:hypothetical protein MSG28_006825 [Choristoneura fumiferana]
MPTDNEPLICTPISLIINQRPEVWEGSEFILSCMAHGSPDIAFAWYKDGRYLDPDGSRRCSGPSHVSSGYSGGEEARRWAVGVLRQRRGPQAVPGAKASCASPA